MSVFLRVRRFFSRTIRGRLTLVVAAVLFPGALLASWLIVRAYDNEQQAVERNLAESARGLSLLMDAALHEHEALLRGLATSRQLHENENLTAFRRQAESIPRAPGEWLVLSSPGGQQLINTSQPEDAELPRSDVPPDLRPRLLEHGVYVSNYNVGPATQQPVVFVTVPVFRADRGPLALSAVMSADAISKRLLDQGIGTGWLITLIDREGTIIARSRNAARYVGMQASPNMRAAVAQRTSGVAETVTLDGIESLTGYNRSAHSGWTVIIAAPRAELLRSAQTLAIVAGLVSILSGVAGVVLAFSIGRAVVRAVQILVRQTRELGEKPDAVRPTGMDETDVVSRALQEAAGALRAREAELAGARDAAVAASRAKDEFLATLSHELRTPLNPVLLVASDAAEDPKLPPEVRATFQTIVKNVQLEARLIDDLLDLTRIVRGKLALEQQPVDVHTVLDDALATVRGAAREKPLELCAELAARPSVVSGDSTRLQQVFWNILNNAVKFTPPPGRVTVATRAEAGHVIITITDTGIGLTHEELGRIFKSFAQGDHAGSTPSRFGGLGLGLAISRLLVARHGGKLTAESEGRDRGATFRIELPLLPEEASPPGRRVREGTAPEAAVHGGGTSVLVVEDHGPTRQVLTGLLERRGYVVTAAGSVAEALALAGQKPHDFVISDIGLPDGDGHRLMQTLRERHGLRGIALSGYGTEADIGRGRASGFVVYLTKPIDRRSLDSALAQYAAAPREVDVT